MDSHTVRIYRRDSDTRKEMLGIVADVEGVRDRPFSNTEERWNILKDGGSGGIYGLAAGEGMMKIANSNVEMIVHVYEDLEEDRRDALTTALKREGASGPQASVRCGIT